MNSFIAFLLALATSLMALVAPLNKCEIREDKSDFKPVLRFMVFSDSHVGAIGDTNAGRVQKAIMIAYDKAEECETYKKLDGIMACGDITNKGTTSQYIGFVSAVNSVIKEETKLMAVQPKSHDCNTKGKEALKFFSDMTSLPNDWHYVINGYHFIGVSTSTTEGIHYTEDQVKWLDEQLSAAVEDAPDKPVFVTNHEHVQDTVYGSLENEWGTSVFSETLKKYPQVVHFSGHSHYPINDPRSIWQNEITCIGTGAVKYLEFTVDGVIKLHPAGNKKTGQFWLVEVNENGDVRLRGYDTYSENLLCEYVLNNPSKSENRVFSDNMERKSKAPEFPSGSSLKCSKVAGIAKVKVPKAESTDGEIVFLYRVTSYNREGEMIDSAYCINNYWNIPDYDEVDITVRCSAGGKIEAVAENAYGMRNEPLTIDT